MFPHARRRRGLALAAIVAVTALTASCAGGARPADDEPSQAAQDEEPEGEITVVTWRTDLLEDGTMDEYKERFEEAYPDVTVTFEGHTDYEGEVKTRMSTEDYGDVLAIVGTVQPAQLADFFEPLGTIEELEEEYRFVRDKAYEGTGYGIPVVGNTQGIVYNKAVFEEAGVEGIPETPEQFVDALQQVKDNTEAIPLYTNYAAGWTVTQWEGHRGSVSADPNYVNSLLENDAPWTEGSDHFVIDSLLWDVVEAGLIEEDPTTTDWEASKGMLGRGEIATMVLGSWAITQMQDAADNPEDIGYLPFPAMKDGVFHASVGGDYNWAINKHSEHKAAARAWIEWFNHESGYAQSQGGLSPLKDGEFPDTLADFEELGVEFVEQYPAEPGNEGKIDEIDNTAEIGLWQDIYRKRIIDAARGQLDESKQDIFDDLNQRWADARAEVMG